MRDGWTGRGVCAPPLFRFPPLFLFLAVRSFFPSVVLFCVGGLGVDEGVGWLPGVMPACVRARDVDALHTHTHALFHSRLSPSLARCCRCLQAW